MVFLGLDSILFYEFHVMFKIDTRFLCQQCMCWANIWRCCRKPLICLSLPVIFCLAVFWKFAKLTDQYVKAKYCAIALVIVLFYGEIFVYWKANSEWKKEVHKHEMYNGNDKVIKLLLVGDPQLIGYFKLKTIQTILKK